MTVYAMAHAHRMVIVMLDVANGVIRRRHGGKRRGQRSTADQGGQTGNGLEKGFHAWSARTAAKGLNKGGVKNNEL